MLDPFSIYRATPRKDLTCDIGIKIILDILQVVIADHLVIISPTALSSILLAPKTHSSTFSIPLIP